MPARHVQTVNRQGHYYHLRLQTELRNIGHGVNVGQHDGYCWFRVRLHSFLIPHEVLQSVFTTRARLGLEQPPTIDITGRWNKEKGFHLVVGGAFSVHRRKIRNLCEVELERLTDFLNERIRDL